MSESYDKRMCQICCKLGLTARHTHLLVSSRLTKNLPSEASFRSSPRRSRKPTEFPIVRGAVFGTHGRITREIYTSDDEGKESAIHRAITEMWIRTLGSYIDTNT